MRNLKIFLLITSVTFYTFIAADTVKAQAYNWTSLGSGTNGSVYTMVKRGNNIVVGGKFTQAGSLTGVINIAQFDTNGNWFPIGSLNDSVNALIIFNTQLLAATGNRVARWNGFAWVDFGTPFDNEVRALAIHRGNLIAGGLFTSSDTILNLNHIAYWDGFQWQRLSTGLNNDVYALTVDTAGSSGILYVGGRFTIAGGQPALNIAKWDVISWSPLGSGTNGFVHALTYSNSQLIIGGEFTMAGGNPANRIASWNGTNWGVFGSGTNDWVLSLGIYNNQLIAGGIFKFANGHYVDRIAKWNGTDWSRLITGMNRAVNCLFTDNTNLFAGGQFTTAGGKYISHTALWNLQPTVTISGIVRYSDSSLVPSGKVKAVRLDVNTREIIVLDSASIQNGNYTLPRVPRDSNVYVISFPSDEFLRAIPDFIPTYYPSAIDWHNAVRLVPVVNLDSINVSVTRITPEPQTPLLADLGGHVYLRFMPPQSLNDVGLPYKSGAIVYARQGIYYREFVVSNTLEEYNLPQLAPGTYDLYVNRLGYTSASRTVTLGTVSIDTVDFYLDPDDLIGIKNISSEVPKNFALYQNFPNPFNASSKFRVQSSKLGLVKIEVFDVLGRLVKVLVDEELEPGIYEVTFDASELSSGLYFYRMSADEFIETRRMVLLK